MLVIQDKFSRMRRRLKLLDPFYKWVGTTAANGTGQAEFTLDSDSDPIFYGLDLGLNLDPTETRDMVSDSVPTESSRTWIQTRTRIQIQTK